MLYRTLCKCVESTAEVMGNTAAAAVLLAPAELVRTPVERMTEKSLRRKGTNITRASVGLSMEMEETAQLTSVK